MCEAIGFDYQLFKVDCNDLHDLNVFTSIAIVSCGMNNQEIQHLVFVAKHVIT